MGILLNRARSAALGLIAMTLAVACAGQDAADDVSDATPTTPSSASSPASPLEPSDAATSSPSPSPSSPPSTRSPTSTPMPEPSHRPTTPPLDEETISPPGSITLVGVPRAGVEMNCWLLDDYLLLGGDRELIESGDRLEITGQPMKGTYTTCMQGTPFEVVSITRAPTS